MKCRDLTYNDIILSDMKLWISGDYEFWDGEFQGFPVLPLLELWFCKIFLGNSSMLLSSQLFNSGLLSHSLLIPAMLTFFILDIVPPLHIYISFFSAMTSQDFFGGKRWNVSDTHIALVQVASRSREKIHFSDP